jgi:hypothetical protein
MCGEKMINKYSIIFYSILFYSILFYSILFYSILFYSILSSKNTDKRHAGQIFECAVKVLKIKDDFSQLLAFQ